MEVVCDMCIAAEALLSLVDSQKSGGGALQTLGIHQKTMLWMKAKNSAVLKLTLLKMLSSSNQSFLKIFHNLQK